MDNKELKASSDFENKKLEKESERIYYTQSLKDGYRGLIGAIVGTLVAEVILWFADIKFNSAWTFQTKGSNNVFSLMDNIPLIFIAVGFIFTVRHVAQIWQAKTQLKQLSLDD